MNRRALLTGFIATAGGTAFGVRTYRAPHGFAWIATTEDRKFKLFLSDRRAAEAFAQNREADGVTMFVELHPVKGWLAQHIAGPMTRLEAEWVAQWKDPSA